MKTFQINEDNQPIEMIRLTMYINEMAKSGKTYDIEVKEHRNKRSLDANAYYWVLVNAIANNQRANKDDVHFEMLKSYGQVELISVKSEIDMSGYLKYYEEAGETELNGIPFTHYRVYKGSSEMDTKEMSILIDGVVQEAKQLDIETLTPMELDRLKRDWDKDEKHIAG